MLVRNASELLAERRKRLYWDDCFNIKSVQPAALLWDANYGAWSFPGNLSNRYLWIVFQMPHSKAMGGIAGFHIHWMPATNNVNVVKWDAEYWWKNTSGDTAQGAAGGGGTAVTINTTPNGTAYVLQMDHFADWAAPANEEISSIITVRLNRDGAADANNDIVLLKDFDVHVQHDSFGSVSDDVKWGS